MPPPPQVWPATVQAPQSTVPPQPSPMVPQVALTAAQVSLVQVPPPPLPHWKAVPPPPQVSVPLQVPQTMVPPQTVRDLTAVGTKSAASCSLGQWNAGLVPPHWNWVPPPPQVCGAAQEPQSTVPPQPSPMRPQLALSEAQVTRPQPVAISPVGSGPKSSLPPEMTESLQPMRSQQTLTQQTSFRINREALAPGRGI